MLSPLVVLINHFFLNQKIEKKRSKAQRHVKEAKRTYLNSLQIGRCSERWEELEKQKELDLNRKI